MEDTLNIKCPNDGALLKVRYRPGLENMSITCPVCRQKMPFSKMIKVDSMDRIEKGTQYPDMPQTPIESATQYPQSMAPKMPGCPPPLPSNGMSGAIPNVGMQNIGMQNAGLQNTGPRLRSSQLNQVYSLRVGANIIGRKAPNSSANIQLPASPLKRMSREHIKIEVRQNGNQYQAICSLFKPECNATYVNGMPLSYGNTFILQHGTIITLPDCEVVFEMY